MWDAIKSIASYLGSKPTNVLDLIWRITLVLVLVLGYLRLERIRSGQLETQDKVSEVATAVATVQESLEETPPPTPLPGSD